ncbi:GNAT family N-acetyltransferase [Legionella sp. D16C41]|uniref:GNAT family N-acetyltransferase n=1 Tax=Legionella sp. D16C41 TaxID=3402688 RepID=UPI003AF72489
MTNFKIFIREPNYQDEAQFLQVMQDSAKFHYPFVSAPKTSNEFQHYLEQSKQDRQQSFLAFKNHEIIGVFNINEIVRGIFQSAYLGYYASVKFAGSGLMSQSLKLVLVEIFLNLKLHRIEANIQPTNLASIYLVQRNGFFKEGFSPRYLKINGVWCDHFRFALTYEDWLSNYKNSS